MADEGHSRAFDQPAESHDPAVPFAVVSAGLLVLGGLALIGPPGAEAPTRRRRSFGLLAILVGLAIYLLRPKAEAVSEPVAFEPAVVQPTAPVPVEEPEPVADSEVELSVPEEPEPEPEELLPAAQAERDAEPESNGWHVIAEARERGRARLDSSRPFVVLQSEDGERAEAAAERGEPVQTEDEPREPVEGVVNRVELYSPRPDGDSAELLEADGS